MIADSGDDFMGFGDFLFLIKIGAFCMILKKNPYNIFVNKFLGLFQVSVLKI